MSNKETLVVYHDSIPKQLLKAGDPTAQGNQYHCLVDGTPLTAVQVREWFKPFTVQRRVRTYQDYANNKFVSNIDDFIACDPSRFTHFIFVPPVSGIEYDHAVYLKSARFLLTSALGVDDVVYTVKRLHKSPIPKGPNMWLPFKRESVEGTQLNYSLLHSEYCSYLAYRMSAELTEQLGCKAGISVAQLKLLAWVAKLTETSVDVLTYQVRQEFNDGSMIDSYINEDIVVESLQRRSLTETLEKLKHNVTNISSDTVKTININEALVEEDIAGDNLWKHHWDLGGMYHEKLMTLFARGFIYHPYSSESNPLDQTDKDVLAKVKELHPDTDPQPAFKVVGCDPSRSASELIDIDDRLIDVYLDIRDHYINSICNDKLDLTSRGVAFSHGRWFHPVILLEKSAVAGTHLPYQGRIKFSYVTPASAETTADISQVDTLSISHIKFVSKFNEPPVPFSTFSKEMARLLSKKYVQRTQGGGLILTAFGSAIFCVAMRMFGKAVVGSESILDDNGSGTIQKLEARFNELLSETKTRRASPVLSKEFKIKGKKKKFTLVFKNRGGKKLVYWKSGTLERGVQLKKSGDDFKLTLMRNQSAEKHDASGTNVFLVCSCTNPVAYPKFEKKTKQHVFVCTNCRSINSNHYMTMRRRQC